jgi:selenocysteine-specific elongation factor
MRVIATAGHVDHGKSTLVRALTGINPDRLREEQQREMTIDLGFAWMSLPGGESVGIIDVPGHIDFIDNMLAGVGGIDAALFVIAADEGPMPQTLEHLAILDLLKVPRGVVALTKTDLAPDEEWIELISADVNQLLAGTPLADARIVPVSVRANQGLSELNQALATVLADAPVRRDLGKPRLPVDRAFTLPGFGTVVTGTLADGSLSVGDEVEVITQHGQRLPARVRGLQTHKQKIERALPGSRVAINLTGVDVAQVARGSVVAGPNLLRPATLVDAQVEMLDRFVEPRAHGAAARLRHNAEVKVFSGAAQSLARAWLLDADELAPGAQGWVQLQLSTPMALTSGDRFILRLPSPSVTIGGGTIVDAHPAMRYRRRGGRADARVLQRLESLSRGTPSERLANALHDLGFGTLDDASAKAQLSADEARRVLAEMTSQGLVFVVQGMAGNREAWREAYVAAYDALRSFHAAQPLLQGMPRDTLRSRLRLSAHVFNALLKLAGDAGSALYTEHGDAMASDTLVDEGEVVRLSSHRVQFSPAQQRVVDALIAQCRAQPWATPSVKEARADLGDAAFEALLRQKQLVQLGADVILLPETYDQAVREVRAFIQREGQMTAAQARDLFNTTRKYSLGLMEHLDAIGVTRRVGDARVLRG